MKINNTVGLFPNIFPDYLSSNHHQTATRSFIMRSLSLFSLLCQVTSATQKTTSQQLLT